MLKEGSKCVQGVYTTVLLGRIYSMCLLFKDSIFFMMYSKFILITDYTQFVHLFKVISYIISWHSQLCAWPARMKVYDGNIF